MGMRIVKERVAEASGLEGVVFEGAAFGGETPDDWSDRIVKLIPAEALGLYGTGSAIIPADKDEGLWILAIASLGIAILYRFKATKGMDGKAQYMAVGIAAVSFLLWVMALPQPVGPIDLGTNHYLGALFALIWGVFIPAVYKGD